MVKQEIGFWIQKNVLEEAGWPELKYMQDYFNLLKDYKAKHPQIDGKNTIAFESFWVGWQKMINQALQRAAGYDNDGPAVVDPQTLEVTLKEIGEPYHKGLKIFNQAYNDGLIDPESFVQNADQYKEKLASGRVLGFVILK